MSVFKKSRRWLCVNLAFLAAALVSWGDLGSCPAPDGCADGADRIDVVE